MQIQPLEVELAARTAPRWDRKGVTIFPVDGDRVTCDTCTLASACFAARPGSECTMTEGNGGIWTSSFESGIVDDLDIGLARILKIQADRVQGLLDQPVPDDWKDKDKLRHQERIDRNLDKLYKNALAFRNAKAPRPAAASKVIDEHGHEQLPQSATPAMLAAAIEEMVAIGVPRENITRTDALEHLASQQKIALPAAAADNTDLF